MLSNHNPPDNEENVSPLTPISFKLDPDQTYESIKVYKQEKQSNEEIKGVVETFNQTVTFYPTFPLFYGTQYRVIAIISSSLKSEWTFKTKIANPITLHLTEKNGGSQFSCQRTLNTLNEIKNIALSFSNCRYDEIDKIELEYGNRLTVPIETDNDIQQIFPESKIVVHINRKPKKELQNEITELEKLKFIQKEISVLLNSPLLLAAKYQLFQTKIDECIQNFSLNMKTTEQEMLLLKNELENLQKDFENENQKIKILKKSKSKLTKEIQKQSEKHDKMLNSAESIATYAVNIKNILNESVETLRGWKSKVERGVITSWTESDLHCFLESIGLENWFYSFQKAKVNPSAISCFSTKTLMNFKLNDNNNTVITFGEARFILLSINHILEKKSIPQITGDPNLNISNLKNWTIDNVELYFNKQNKNLIAQSIKKNKINGIVLSSIEETDISFLSLNFTDSIWFANEFISRVIKQGVEVQKKEQKKENLNIPNEYICPITQTLMKDPVSLSNGHTFEREAIQEWFRENHTCPLTREKVSDKRLISNITLKNLIQRWENQNQ